MMVYLDYISDCRMTTLHQWWLFLLVTKVDPPLKVDLQGQG